MGGYGMAAEMRELTEQNMQEFVKEVEKRKIPLHSVLIAQHGNLLFEKYYAPYCRNKLQRMFSVTKSFTSLAIGLLEQEGKISLQDPICGYFPEYLPGRVHPWLAEMTIENMLKMQTCYNMTTYNKTSTTENWVRSFFQTEPTHRPGTLFMYDTSSSHTLCALVEKLTGEKMLDYLKEKNMLDNTLVVYTSDQGFYMGEHGWFDKRFMYEESMHTPLIMRLPKGFDRKGDITELVQNIDYAPTFLELAGAPVSEDIQGVSLLPLLKGEKPADWRKSLYYHFYEYPAEHMVKRHYGVRTERYKLIHFYNDIDVWELYDLQADPTEMHNLYGQKEYEPVVTELKTELARLQEQYKDPVRFSPDRDKE